MFKNAQKCSLMIIWCLIWKGLQIRHSKSDPLIRIDSAINGCTLFEVNHKLNSMDATLLYPQYPHWLSSSSSSLSTMDSTINGSLETHFEDSLYEMVTLEGLRSLYNSCFMWVIPDLNPKYNLILIWFMIWIDVESVGMKIMWHSTAQNAAVSRCPDPVLNVTANVTLNGRGILLLYFNNKWSWHSFSKFLFCFYFLFRPMRTIERFGRVFANMRRTALWETHQTCPQVIQS